MKHYLICIYQTSNIKCTPFPSGAPFWDHPDAACWTFDQFIFKMINYFRHMAEFTYFGSHIGFWDTCIFKANIWKWSHSTLYIQHNNGRYDKNKGAPRYFTLTIMWVKIKANGPVGGHFKSNITTKSDWYSLC